MSRTPRAVPLAVRLALPALVGLAFASMTRASLAQEPRLPKLGDASPAPLATGEAPAAEPGRALPTVETICRDGESGDCWSVPGERPCRDERRPGATVFRVVIAGPERGDVAAALADCRQERSPSEPPRE